MCKVSVLMSVYNENNAFLQVSLESILHQTFQDFEFLIYDDNTCFENKVLLKKYAKIDSRIRIIQNKENRGLTYNLACGVKDAKGSYIARMDSDDISVPWRLEKQYDYMERHTDVVLLTSNVKISRNPSEKIGRIFLPGITVGNYLKTSLLFNNSMPHPTAIIRRSFLIKYNINYDVDIKKAQDYDLWVRIAKKGKIAFMKKPLVHYRIHDGQISNDISGEQHFYVNQIRIKQLLDLGIQLSPEDAQIYLSFCDGKLGTQVWKYRSLINRIQDDILHTNCYKVFWIKYVFSKRMLKNIMKWR